MSSDLGPTRRAFVKTLASAGVALGASGAGLLAQAKPPVRLGLDMYSVGSQNWTPFEQMDFAKKWNVKMVHFSEIRFLGSPDWKIALAPDNLRKIRSRADELNLDVEIGMRSICPTSSGFDATQGTAQEQLGRMIDAAKIIKSPIVRCVLGSQADRRGGIERHIESTIGVLKSIRSKAMDNGVKIAIENHAGDMQARELRMLIEGGGKDFVGACIDSGNAVWTIEDPHLTLETLAPYVLTSHMRDSYVFNSPQGTAVQWSRMGDGNIGMDEYIKKYVAQCPGAAVSLEVIVSGGPRFFNYRDPAAWELFPTTPAKEFARFLALCDKGTPREIPQRGAGAAGGRGAGGGGGRAAGGAAPDPAAQAAARQRNVDDVEASLKWTQGVIAAL